jgi:hypothetical protein
MGISYEYSPHCSNNIITLHGLLPRRSMKILPSPLCQRGEGRIFRYKLVT